MFIRDHALAHGGREEGERKSCDQLLHLLLSSSISCTWGRRKESGKWENERERKEEGMNEGERMHVCGQEMSPS